MANVEIILSADEQVYLARLVRSKLRLKQQHLDALKPYPHQTSEQMEEVRDRLQRKIDFLVDLHNRIDGA